MLIIEMNSIVKPLSINNPNKAVPKAVEKTIIAVVDDTMPCERLSQILYGLSFTSSGRT